jgi:transposase
MTEREAALEAELSASRLENKLLREKVDALVRMIYGRKSEKFDVNQLPLLEEFESKKDAAPVPASEPKTGATGPTLKKRAKPARPRLPDHLPVHEEVLDPDEVKACPQRWRQIGEEVSEQLDFQPAQFLKRRLVRRRFVQVDAPFAAPVIAPLPACLQERCLATPGLIAQVLTSKYVDHLPLYRQEQIYRTRHGVEIPRQTLCRWVELAAWWFEPVYRAMEQEQKARPYLQIDETPIRYLQPGAGRAAQGYFWVTAVPGGDVIYRWYAGRGARYLDGILGDGFKGTLQCDAYSAYTSFQKQRAGPLELAGCWAHVRRKFFESMEREPKVVRWLLGQIAQLYRIERALRENKAGARLRDAVRAGQSAPVVNRIRKALLLLKPRYLPKSGLGKAINYALNQWASLQVFLCNGAIEIDNNQVENAIRPTKLGAKNWLFIGSEGSGQISAIIFTLIESAKRHGLEPHAYLYELLERLPKTANHAIASLTPAAIAKTRQSRAA